MCVDVTFNCVLLLRVASFEAIRGSTARLCVCATSNRVLLSLVALYETTRGSTTRLYVCATLNHVLILRVTLYEATRGITARFYWWPGGPARGTPAGPGFGHRRSWECNLRCEIDEYKGGLRGPQGEGVGVRATSPSI